MGNSNKHYNPYGTYVEAANIITKMINVYEKKINIECSLYKERNKKNPSKLYKSSLDNMIAALLHARSEILLQAAKEELYVEKGVAMYRIDGKD